jgi:uncharacterized Zn ribbon protein
MMPMGYKHRCRECGSEFRSYDDSALTCDACLKRESEARASRETIDFRPVL